MVLDSALSDGFLTRTYLVGDGSGRAFFVDAGGAIGPLIDRAKADGLEVTHILLTHHHYDHVSDLPALREAFPGVPVLVHANEAGKVEGVTGTIEDGERITAGGLEVVALHTPGHTSGMLALVADGDVFTGDTLFRRSVGGVRGPDHTTYADLKRSVMDVLMGLDHDLVVRPGHTDPTTIGEEWEHNPFIRLWRGLDEEGAEQVTVWDQPATLVLDGPDYDGGTKAWVRWEDGRDDIVPGSQVKRPG